MKKMKTNDHELARFESLLETYLQPVTPRADFVRELHRRLLDVSRPSVKIPGENHIRYGLIAAASLAGSLLVVATGIRALLTVLGALGIIHFVKQQVGEKSISPPRLSI
ncbi:MAG TPA: hypothetical protein VE136_06345 [Anaerolineales bacterium]|jgi:hypothetical protein|nr:hypothetical protein [Anaerolineales bacterium]